MQQSGVAQPEAWVHSQLVNLLPQFPEEWFHESNVHSVAQRLSHEREFRRIRDKLPFDRSSAHTPAEEKNALKNAMMLLVAQQLHILQTQLSEGTISRPLPRKYRAGSKDIFTRVHMKRKTFVVGLAHINDAEAEIRRRLERSLLVYDSELGGIPIAFHRLQLLMTRVKISYSPPVVEVPCSYEMLLFTPRPRTLMSGTIVNFGNQGIDMLVFDLFNAQVKYTRDATPALDANDLQEGDVLEFRIRSLGFNGDHIFIEAMFDEDVKLVRRGTAQERAAVIAEQQQEQQEMEEGEEEDENSNGHQEETTEEHGPEYDDDSDSGSEEEEEGRKRAETPEQPKKKKRRTH